jgi:hypothetical protein
MTVKATIRLFKVPEKFYEQARDLDFVCQHLFSSGANGATIGLHDVVCSDEGHQAALCADCEEQYKGGAAFEFM